MGLFINQYQKVDFMKVGVFCISTSSEKIDQDIVLNQVGVVMKQYTKKSRRGHFWVAKKGKLFVWGE